MIKTSTLTPKTFQIMSKQWGPLQISKHLMISGESVSSLGINLPPEI